MLINSKILNIPPFISAQWSQIEFITTEKDSVIIHFKSKKKVVIPEASPELIQKIFQAHKSFAESERPIALPPIPPLPQGTPLFGSSDIKVAFSNMEPGGVGIPLQHLDELRDAPNIPHEVLEKVKLVSKLVPPEDLANSPKPVENCNCPFCQIASTIHGDLSLKSSQETQEEEIVDDADLKFETWSIIQEGDNLFKVQNKLDSDESYSVSLGEPVGCTCGKQGCEHILAVLKS